ncbi:hypothetical protein EV401DRAFT_1893671 [Pisolithus croceorrhizus]|nr:hypothetical protein EV401DRAFT_1893671 [Pisolithus croceorrhizus]
MSVWTCKSKSGHLQTRGEIIEMEGLRLKLDHESKHVMEDKRGVCCLNDLFHLSPFMILDHHTISSVDYLGPSSSIPVVGLKLQSNHNDTPARDCFLDQPGHPEVPNETFNAFRSSDDSNDDGLASSGKYNHMTLERAQKDIHTADQFIRHVWLTIRQSGHTPAFEYAMQEDHSHLAGTSGYLSRLLLQDVNCELLRELYEMYC